MKVESAPKTYKIKKVSFGDIYIFFSGSPPGGSPPGGSPPGGSPPDYLILRYHRISKNVNLIQNNSFYENRLFSEWAQS